MESAAGIHSSHGSSDLQSGSRTGSVAVSLLYTTVTLTCIDAISSVQDVRGSEDRLVVELSILPVGMETLGHSCSIRYEHNAAGVWQTEEQYQLQKRAVSGQSLSTPGSINVPLPKHATLFPLVAGNATMVPKNASE